MIPSGGGNGRQVRRALSGWIRQSLSLLIGLALAACSQISSLQNVSTLPPTFAIPTQGAASATASPTPPAPTLELTATDTQMPATLTTAEMAQTQAADTLAAFIQTQLETLAQASLTPTPCPARGCTTPTATRTPYRSPTPTLTPTPIFPAAYIQITWPGPLSKVVSPIHLLFNTHTGPKGVLQVELIGEDGRILYRQVYRSTSDDLTYYNVDLPVDFEIPGVAEAARLQVSVVDASQRLVAVSSINLVLLAMGDEEVNPPDDGVAAIVLRQPYLNQLITGGKLHVEGLVRPLNTSPLQFELTTDDGKLVGSRQFSADAAPLGAYQPFSLDIPYTVSQQRSVRLTVSQQGDKIPGVILAESVVVWLEP